jgi:gamma-glutamylcysteine synthetase
MSSYGIEYVENKFDIKPNLSGEEKVKKVLAGTAEWGWEQIKDIGAKVLAEMAKA